MSSDVSILVYIIAKECKHAFFRKLEIQIFMNGAYYCLLFRIKLQYRYIVFYNSHASTPQILKNSIKTEACQVRSFN